MTNDTIKAFRAQSYLFRRYIWLLSILYDYKRLSFKEISCKWENCIINDDGLPFPKRTFRDHLDAIQEIFGITIKNENKGEYRYYIENIDDLDSNKLHSWILDNFSLSNALSGAKDIEDRIIFQDIPSSKRWLSTIIGAIKNRNVILMDYTSRTRGIIPRLRLYPLFVKLYDNRWYMYAKDKASNVMKNYALDCIDNITLSDDRFDYEPSDDERYMLDNSFGHSIYPDIKPQNIYVKASVQAAKFLDTLPLHHTQEKIKEEKNQVIYKYFFAPTPEFKYALKKWGGQLKWISEEK